MTMRTHAAYPLTPANQKLYKRLHRLANKRRREQDAARRLELRYEIGRLTQEIRKMGMR